MFREIDRIFISSAPKAHRSSGFTLIELMVVIAIGAILVTVAGPSYNTFMKSQQLSAAINDYTAALRQARSEAIKANAPVELCPPNADRDDCEPNGSLLDGWLIVRSIGDNRVVLADTRLSTQNLVITSQVAPAVITFDRLGQRANAQNSIGFCAKGSTLAGKNITINVAGQASESPRGC